MRVSTLVKNMWRYLPVLIVLAAIVIGLLIGKGLYPGSLASQSPTPAFVSIELKEPQLLPTLDTPGTCLDSGIYMSFPPKCKTLEGEFMLVPGTSNLFVIPEPK